MELKTYIPKLKQEFAGIQWDGTEKQAFQILGWVLENGDSGYVVDGPTDDDSKVLVLVDADGTQDLVYKGYWVLKDVEDYWYVYTPEGFEEDMQEKPKHVYRGASGLPLE